MNFELDSTIGVGVTWPLGAPRQLHDSIDVVAQLAEQAARIAGSGANERALSEVLDAAFTYMVAYSHYLTIDPDHPKIALLKAAAGLPELGPSEVEFLRAQSRTLLGPRRT